MLGVGCQGKARRVLTYRDLQVRQTAMDWALESYKLAGLIKSSTRTRKLEFRGHGAHAKLVILKGPDLIGTTKDLRSPSGTFTGWPFKETAGILSAPKNGGRRMTRGRLTPETWHLTPGT